MSAQRPPPPPYQSAPQGESDRPTKTTGSVPEYFRTMLCTHYLPGGDHDCPYGERCRFAHGNSQLRTVEMNLKDGLTTDDAVKQFMRRPGGQRPHTGTVLVPPPPPSAPPLPLPPPPASTPKKPTPDGFPTLQSLYADAGTEAPKAVIAPKSRTIINAPAPIECDEDVVLMGSNDTSMKAPPSRQALPRPQALLPTTSQKQAAEPPEPSRDLKAAAAVPDSVPPATIAPPSPGFESLFVFWDMSSIRPPHRDVFQSAWTEHIVPALESKGFARKTKTASLYVHAFACDNDPAMYDHAHYGLLTVLNKLVMNLHVAPTPLEVHSAMMAALQALLDDETDGLWSGSTGSRRSVGVVLLTNQTICLIEKLNRFGMLKIPTCIVHDGPADSVNPILSFWATETLPWPSTFSRYPTPLPQAGRTSPSPPAKTAATESAVDRMQAGSSPDRSVSSQSVSQGETECLLLGGSLMESLGTSRTSPAPAVSSQPPSYASFLDQANRPSSMPPPPAAVAQQQGFEPLTREALGTRAAPVAPVDQDTTSESSSTISNPRARAHRLQPRPVPKAAAVAAPFTLLRRPPPPPYDQQHAASAPQIPPPSRFLF